MTLEPNEFSECLLGLAMVGFEGCTYRVTTRQAASFMLNPLLKQVNL